MKLKFLAALAVAMLCAGQARAIEALCDPVTYSCATVTSGSVSVTATSSALPTGAATATNQTAVQGTVGAATAPANMVVGGAVYNSTKPTLTTGQGAGLQLDTKGNLLGQIRDAAGNDRGANVNASNQLSVTVDNAPVLGAGTALIGKAGIDQTTPGTTNLVSAGFSQQVASDPTVQNASYSSGNSIGGIQAVTVTANNGQSGFVTNFRVVSVGGIVPALTLYLFDANPSASTCTDKTAFTLNSADIDKLIYVSPTAITMAAPTGTTSTVASFDLTPPRPFIAGGSTASGVKTIYYCVVDGTTVTPGSTTDIHTRVGVVLN